MFIWAVQFLRILEHMNGMASYLEPLGGGAEVDVCHHIPIGNWLACFSLLRMSCKSVIDRNIWLLKWVHWIAYILATISHIFPENPLIKLFRCYSAHQVSILTFMGFAKLFQEALESRSMDHTVKHTQKINSYSQAFNLQKRLRKGLANTKMTSNSM